jgi:hypothetical protein
VKEEVDFSGQPIFRFAKGEVHLFNDRHEDKVQYPFDWYRSALATITERADNTKLSWFKRWLGGLLFISPDPRRMSALAQTESAFPAIDLSNFADWYRHLRLESDDRALVDDLRDVIAGFESMDLKEAGLNNRVLMLKLSSVEGQGTARRNNSSTTETATTTSSTTTSTTTTQAAGTAQRSYPYFFYELSDGQRVLISLYTILHFALRPGATICFDEPDNFIALRELQPWLNKVLDRVEYEDPHPQVFIISHHPELLNQMAFQDVLLLDRPGGRHTRARPFDDPSQTGLSPAELIARGWDRE